MFEQFTVTSGAVSALNSEIYGGRHNHAVQAYITTDGETRFRMDGQDPSTTIGHKKPSGSITLVSWDSIRKFRIIATSADVEVVVTYFRNAP